MPETQGGQSARSLATQKALMEAAEKLIAEKGLKFVSIKEIVRAAGQKNESALQYHFGGLKGLISELLAARDKEIRRKRTELLETLLADHDTPTLRELCEVMVMPTILLARSNPGYRRHLVGFSQEIAISPESALSTVSRHGGGGKSGQKTGELLRQALPHLDERAYKQRMDFAVRMASISIGHHARQKSAFRGHAADCFVNELIDAMVGVLTAEVSPETRDVLSRG